MTHTSPSPQNIPSPPQDSSAKTKIAHILLFAVLACIAIGYVDYYVNNITYFTKATGKLCLFLGTPLLYGYFHREFQPKKLLVMEKKPLLFALALGLGVFAVIFGAYILLGSLLDLSAVTSQLENRLQITGENFVAVAVYIALCNSFLEEFFFRGFVFFQLKEASNLVFAHCVSALLFALYHVAIMAAWFDWWVFALCLLGLFVGGLIFNALDHYASSLYPSWLTHMFANFALNSIGMILFYG